VRHLPIRLRLTLWYSLLFATAALLLTSASWWMLRSAIDSGVNQELQERVDDIRTQLLQFGPTLTPAESQARFDAIYRLRDDGKWLQIADQSGQWIYRSARMTSLQRPSDELAKARPVARISEFDQGSRHVRSLRSPITVDGHTYLVETGLSMNKQLVLLHRFGLSLLLLTPAVFLAAIVAGHWMSRKAFSPVSAIVHEARRITERNLDRRLPISPAEDELALLSVTLNNMLGRIDAGFRSVRDFTANASHELRTPLALLRTEAEIALLSPRSPQEYRDTLEHVQSAANGMTKLIESLLTLARAEAGAEMLRHLDVDMRALVGAVVEEWLPVTRRLGIELVSSSPNQSIVAAGDRLALLQLLRIWLDNACKFTSPGGRIVILIEAVQGGITLGVQDSGIGIPADEQERIFERFYRSSKDHGHNGAGLGLSLATWIAQQHGSRIRVVSAPGEGAFFSISLHAVSANDAVRESHCHAAAAFEPAETAKT
jgi:signal transduction histidine kinase